MTNERSNDFPTGWVLDAVLADGGTVHIRPIRPDELGGAPGLLQPAIAGERALPFFQRADGTQ